MTRSKYEDEEEQLSTWQHQRQRQPRRRLRHCSPGRRGPAGGPGGSPTAPRRRRCGPKRELCRRPAPAPRPCLPTPAAARRRPRLTRAARRRGKRSLRNRRRRRRGYHRRARVRPSACFRRDARQRQRSALICGKATHGIPALGCRLRSSSGSSPDQDYLAGIGLLEQAWSCAGLEAQDAFPGKTKGRMRSKRLSWGCGQQWHVELTSYVNKRHALHKHPEVLF